MSAYYNEIDPYAAQWLRNLIATGHIAAGDVDERSIVDVRPDDLRPYRQCHFFAGIGGWSYALRLAGWDDKRPVWTGSCPCQPLSVAGKRGGHADERHLWPAFYRLIAECRPATVFGEQVASKDGREWLAAVRADLEGAGYAVGCANLPVCSVGAPHIRQRLWFVGQSMHAERWPLDGDGQDGCDGTDDGRPQAHGFIGAPSEVSGELADRSIDGWREERADGGRVATGDRTQGWPAGFEPSGGAGELADAESGEQRRSRFSGESERRQSEIGRYGAWDDLVWLPCTDGKARPTQSGIFPLAHGVSARVGKLRAAGNAIVPQVAAEFVKAYLVTPEMAELDKARAVVAKAKGEA